MKNNNGLYIEVNYNVKIKRQVLKRTLWYVVVVEVEVVVVKYINNKRREEK